MPQSLLFEVEPEAPPRKPKRVEASGLTGMQCWALGNVEDFPGLTTEELTRELGLKDSTLLVERLNQIEKLGVIEFKGGRWELRYES